MHCAAAGSAARPLRAGRFYKAFKVNIDSHTFNQRFDSYGQWRASLSHELEDFAGWLQEKGLADAATLERLERLQVKTTSGKITVAFVAEFSRGKSELINALFFSSYGRRIMPASAGRTTMCPTELSWEPELKPCVRLLPIETRKLTASLADWRVKKSSWVTVPFDPMVAESVAKAIEMVTETVAVDIAEARRLGFFAAADDADEGRSVIPSHHADGQELVQVPKWRHAIINFPHPMLKKGLVILDTPGMNAIGAEPELTISLLPQAQAVLFILGAETGVTRSDLSIWQDQLLKHVDSIGLRLAVLNKIDTLWDELSTKSEQEATIRRQRQNVAQVLDLPLNHVLAVSAQKALLAKIHKDLELLKASSIRQLESVLVDSLLNQRHALLNKLLFTAISDVRAQAERVLNMRVRDITEQAFEISNLQGKNSTALRSVKMRIARERKEFDTSVNKILGLRAAQNKMLNNVFARLSGKTVKQEMAELSQDLQKKMITIGSAKLYNKAFENLQEVIIGSQDAAVEIKRMLTESYMNLNTEFGFSLQPPQDLNLMDFRADLEKIAESNRHLFSIGNALKMSSAEFAERVVNAIAMRIRSVFEAAANELELWSKTNTTQLDVQLRERRQSFMTRTDTVERIHQAELDLNDRLQELDTQLNEVKKDSISLSNMARSLMLSINEASVTLTKQAQEDEQDAARAAP